MSDVFDISPMAQGFMQPATQGEIDKEATYTRPNLHRRMESDIPIETGQIKPSEYSVGVFGTDSYRTVKSYYRDDDTTESEIP